MKAIKPSNGKITRTATVRRGGVVSFALFSALLLSLLGAFQNCDGVGGSQSGDGSSSQDASNGAGSGAGSGSGSGSLITEPAVTVTSMPVGYSATSAFAYSSPGAAVTGSAQLVGSTAFSLASSADGSFTLAAGQSRSVGVVFAPSAEANYSAILEVRVGSVTHRTTINGTGISNQNLSAIWTGAKNRSWSDAANWSGQLVPSAAVNCTIPASQNSPLIDTAKVSCHNITLTGAGTLDFGGASRELTISGNLTGDAAFRFAGADLAQLTLNGSGVQNVRLATVFPGRFNAASTVYQFTNVIDPSKVVLYSPGTFSPTGAVSVYEFYYTLPPRIADLNVTSYVNVASNLNVAGKISVSGALTIQGGVTVTGQAGLLDLGPDATHPGLVMILSGATLSLPHRAPVFGAGTFGAIINGGMFAVGAP